MNLLLSIVQSDWFLIIAIVWGIIALTDRDERESLLVTIGDLITKPVIFKHDENSRSIRFYAREFLEYVSSALTSGLFAVITRLMGMGKLWRKNLEERYSRDDSSLWKMIGSVTLLIAMVAFLYADLIAIFNTLNQSGLILDVPEVFRRYEYAVTFGSFFTIVLSGLVLIEIFGKSIFMDMTSQPRAARVLLTWVSIFLVISGVAVAIGLGLDRYRALANLNPTLESNIGDFNTLVLTVLVPLNSIIATFLIVSEGLKGLPIVAVLLSQIALYAVVTFLFLFGVFNYPAWFVIDVSYRLALIVSYLVFFYILAPLDRIFSWKPFAGEPEAENSDGGQIINSENQRQKKRSERGDSGTTSGG